MVPKIVSLRCSRGRWWHRRFLLDHFVDVLIRQRGGRQQRTIERRNEKSIVGCPSEEEEEEEEEKVVFFDEKTMRLRRTRRREEEEEEGEEKAARSRELFAGTMLFAVFARARTLCDADVSISLENF